MSEEEGGREGGGRREDEEGGKETEGGGEDAYTRAPHGYGRGPVSFSGVPAGTHLTSQMYSILMRPGS